MTLTGFYRCDCGKLHTVGGTGGWSVCKCGRPLMAQALAKGRITR